MTMLPPIPTLNFLTADYLGAWNQHPSSGSMMVPLWDSGPGGPGFRSEILDYRNGRNALETVSSVLQDCRNLRDGLLEQGHPLPQPLPARAAGWMLTGYQDGNAGVGAKAQFQQAEQTKSLTLDLLNPAFASFQVTLQNGPVELTQKIDVDRKRFFVSTEYYFLKMQVPQMHRAAELAILFANLVYDSKQYHPGELGDFLFRDSETNKDAEGKEKVVETPLNRVGKLFNFEGASPFVNELQLVSALSVFDAGENQREAVMTVTASPLKSDGPYSVSLLLYRSPNRTSKRMPLHSRLQKVLWESLGKKLEG